MVGRQSLKLLVKVRILLPEPWPMWPCQKNAYSGVVQPVGHRSLKPLMLVRLQPPEFLVACGFADGASPQAANSVLVEQPGVLATLSRWRSWVQIPSGTLAGTVRKPVKRPSSSLGECLWVRFPPVLLRNASAGHWRASLPVKQPR